MSNEPTLNIHTQRLVDDFARALAEKLLAAQIKYGRSDGWMFSDWEEECRKKLHEHIKKGDPRDAAAYCAFMWYHGWSTATGSVCGTTEESK